MQEPIVFLRGELIARSRAHVPVRDAAFRHGEGLFETLRARRERVFRLDRHLRRLRASASAIGWTLPWTDDELGLAVTATLRANQFREARVRLQATPGRAGLDAPEGPPLLLIEAEPFVGVSAILRSGGATVGLSAHRRDRRGAAVGAKTCSYLGNLLARRAARAAGCFEAVLLNDADQVCEAAMANLFAVRDGALWTPPREAGALEGITREAVIELARREEGPPLREEPFGLGALCASAEVFLTSTGVEVLPVVRVADRQIGDGRPGPVARELGRAYDRLLDDELGPVAH